MKVLVTGGSGFLGINLIRFLRTKGVEEIRVLDIADFDYPEKSEPWLKFTLGDVRDVPAVEEIWIMRSSLNLRAASRTLRHPSTSVVRMSSSL